MNNPMNNDFVIEVDTTILQVMSAELDRRGYGRRNIFNAIPKKNSKGRNGSKKIPYFNQDRYGACCSVCSRLIPVQTYDQPESEAKCYNVDNEYIYALDKVYIFICNKDCKEVLELNPLAYETYTLFEDIYVQGT